MPRIALGELAHAMAVWLASHEGEKGRGERTTPLPWEGDVLGRGPRLLPKGPPVLLIHFSGPRQLPYPGSVDHLFRAASPLSATRKLRLTACAGDRGVRSRARLWLPEPGVVAQAPIDLAAPVADFLDRTAPSAVCFVGRSLRPMFVEECSRRGIPVGMLADGPPDMGLAGQHQLHCLTKPTFERLAVVGAVDAPTRRAFEAAGSHRTRCFVVGALAAAGWHARVLKLLSSLLTDEPAARLREATNSVSSVDPATHPPHPLNTKVQ